MSKFVPIEDIVVTRSPGNPEPDPVVVADLATSIHDEGLKYPILLDEDLNLIDGLNRIRAHQLLGRTTIEATIATTLEEAVAALDQVGPKYPDLPLRRVYEIHNVLKPMVYRRKKELVAFNNRRKHGTPAKSQPHAREMIMRSLRVPSPGIFDTAKWLFGHLQDPSLLGTYVRELISQLERGELTPYSAATRLRNFRKMHQRELDGGLAYDPQRQRQAMQAALVALDGLASGFESMGNLHPDIGADEARRWKDQYYVAHAKLYRLSKRLGERIQRG